MVVKPFRRAMRQGRAGVDLRQGMPVQKARQWHPWRLDPGAPLKRRPMAAESGDTHDEP